MSEFVDALVGWGFGAGLGLLVLAEWLGAPEDIGPWGVIALCAILVANMGAHIHEQRATQRAEWQRIEAIEAEVYRVVEAEEARIIREQDFARSMDRYRLAAFALHVTRGRA